MIERIETETLTVPFPDLPAGGNIREFGPASDLYLQIKDERAAARLSERDATNSESDGDPLRAGLNSWAALADGAVTILTEQSKDLEVAAWLAEALLRTGGVAGLADGLLGLEGLISGFWDDGLWPAAGEDGDEDRVAPLFGLFGRDGTGTLLQPLKLVPLSDRGDTPVTLWSAELAFAPPPPRTADEDAQAIADERRSAALDTVVSGIGRSSRDFLIDLRASLVRAIEALDRLMATIDRVSTVGRFGSQINAPLAAALKLLDDNAGSIFAEAVAQATSDTIDDAEVGDARPVTPGGEPRTRDQALNGVLTLANYFERTEPQSPIGPALRDVVRRARLPLEALLMELLPDSSVRTLFLQRAGIRSATSDVDSYE